MAKKYQKINYGEGFALSVVFFSFCSLVFFIGEYENQRYLKLPKSLEMSELTVLEIKPTHNHFHLKTVSNSGKIYETSMRYCSNYEAYKNINVGDKIKLSTFQNNMINVCIKD